MQDKQANARVYAIIHDAPFARLRFIDSPKVPISSNGQDISHTCMKRKSHTTHKVCTSVIPEFRFIKNLRTVCPQVCVIN